ncbi:uncharacterized protein [Pseudorasbora parva]|uniref:uncharacterized protein isoform X2 n=1 Tax=Pseudorasbora parva TaxID=51549 RepID=UPI00351F739D
MSDHGHRCYVPGCSGEVRTFHTLPTDKKCQQAWLMFIYNRIPERFNAKLFVCSAHFNADSFSNLGQYRAGFAHYLQLKKGSIPTILQGSTSQPGRGSEHLPPSPRSHDVGCQTDSTETPPPKRRSIATQLSWGTLKETHVRSKGTQYKVSSFGVGAETTPSLPVVSLSSTPIKSVPFTPCKRRRVELDEEEEDADISGSIAEPHDSTYNPDDSAGMGESGLCQQSPYNVSKYIVFESCLRELFDTCPLCKTKCDVWRRRMGTYVSFTQLCPKCSYHRKWESQPVIGSTPVGNLLVSAATYFSGASFIQFQTICKAMQLQIIHYDAFQKHARNYLEPAIVHKWNLDQNSLFRKLQEEGKVAVAGDMRTDTLGHSVKYGSYTLMHLASNTILDMQLVQSDEVGGSCHMEKEGLKRCLDHLESKRLEVEYILTDRHPQIQTFLRERNIAQLYDLWHFEKGLSKKLAKLSQQKGCEIVKNWLCSIKNHVHWSATSSTSGPEKVAKWTSLLNHIQNIHIHENPVFPKCAHPDKVSRDPKKWFQPGSVPLHKVEKILSSKRVLKDVGKLSHHHHTSSLEAFRRVILRFAPKNVAFPFIGMLCRLYLAAMHYNENGEHERASSRSKGDCPAQPLKTAPSYDYVTDLMKLVFEELFADPAPFVQELMQIPIPTSRSSVQNAFKGGSCWPPCLALQSRGSQKPTNCPSASGNSSRN